MTELSQTILSTYQIRKTQKQKTEFIRLLQKYFPDLEIQSKGKTRNLIVGDVENASVVFSAHYDTGARLLFPHFIAPKSPVLSVLYSLVSLLPAALGVLAVNLLLYVFRADFLTHYLASMVVACGLVCLKYMGPANRHNANDNTSGVITLCELMINLSASEKRKAVFVFFDREETGLQGSSLFYRRYRHIMKDKLLVNFDCVSDGDHIMVAATKDARKKYTKELDKSFSATKQKSILQVYAEKVYYPSDHRNFPCSVVIGSLHHKPIIGYYLSRVHTPRDTVMDKSNIKLLCDSMLKLLKKL